MVWEPVPRGAVGHTRAGSDVTPRGRFRAAALARLACKPARPSGSATMIHHLNVAAEASGVGAM
jgi:hypothetical protein